MLHSPSSFFVDLLPFGVPPRPGQQITLNNQYPIRSLIGTSGKILSVEKSFISVNHPEVGGPIVVKHGAYDVIPRRNKHIVMVAYRLDVDQGQRFVTFSHNDGSARTFPITRKRALVLTTILRRIPFKNVLVSVDCIPFFDGWTAHISTGGVA